MKRSNAKGVPLTQKTAFKKLALHKVFYTQIVKRPNAKDDWAS
ncbi:hypothetical protein N406_08545 [Helicobacter pylori FD577]|nr:hypothetical protein N406_08545 [Helicobacter pylori FD577]